MTGLDTYVLVRYLAQDDAIQSLRAAKIIEQQLTGQDPGFISLVTMVETVSRTRLLARSERGRMQSYAHF